MFLAFKRVALGRRINILFRLMMTMIRKNMKTLGFGAGDYAFLPMIFAHPGLSQDQLSREVRVDKSYTTRALNRLEKMELIRREPDPEQHRIKRVYPTERGMEIEAEFLAILKNLNAVLIKGLEEERVDQLRADLDQMIENMETYLAKEDEK